jgi:hypothetical protein
LLLGEERGGILGDLDPRGELRLVEVDAGRRVEECGAEGDVDVVGAQLGELPGPDAPGANREAAALHAIAKERLADADDIRDVLDGVTLDPRDRLEAEDPGEGVVRGACVRQGGVFREGDVEAVVGHLDLPLHAVTGERVAQVREQAIAEMRTRGPSLGSDLAREAQQRELLIHGVAQGLNLRCRGA